MTRMRKAALAAISVLVAAASLTSFAESYRALFEWAAHHGLHGVWAAAWPLQVDVFIAVGELSLFVALADRWSVRSRAAAWTVTVLGLAASVAGNVGHIGGHDLASRATAAVPPLAAAAALAVGLGVLKRVVGAHPASTVNTVPAAVPAVVPEAARKPAAKRAPASPAKHANGRAPVTPESAELAFGAQLAEGTVPSLREVKRTLGLGTDRARQVRDHLVSVTR